MIVSLLSIKIHVHDVTDNSNNEIRGGGIKRDAGGDEKQLIKFAWPYVKIAIYVFNWKLNCPSHCCTILSSSFVFSFNIEISYKPDKGGSCFSCTECP